MLYASDLLLRLIELGDIVLQIADYDSSCETDDVNNSTLYFAESDHCNHAGHCVAGCWTWSDYTLAEPDT